MFSLTCPDPYLKYESSVNKFLIGQTKSQCTLKTFKL